MSAYCDDYALVLLTKLVICQPLEHCGDYQKREPEYPSLRPLEVEASWAGVMEALPVSFSTTSTYLATLTRSEEGKQWDTF